MVDKQRLQLQQEVAELEAVLDFVLAHPNSPEKRIELREQVRKLKEKAG
jgi:hypothetical protein